MDDATPAFLQRLGLAGRPDEREIRRAYARLLKLIDPEQRPEDFQALRGDFELSLRWAAVGGSDPRMPDIPAPPAIAEGSRPPVQPDTLPHATSMADFEQWLPAFSSTTQARQALETALADERLALLDERLRFEQAIADRLVAGWQPGHEFLFDAAALVFGWRERAGVLALRGATGRRLNEAVEQQMQFEAAWAPGRSARCALIERARATPEPDTAALLDAGLPMQHLLDKHRAWLQLTLPAGRVEAWTSAWDRLAPDEAEFRRSMAVPSHLKPLAHWRYAYLYLAVFAASIVWALWSMRDG